MAEQHFRPLRKGLYIAINGKDDLSKAKYIRGTSENPGGWLPSQNFLQSEHAQNMHLDLNLFPNGKLPKVFVDAVESLNRGEQLSIEWVKDMNAKHRQAFYNGDEEELTCGFDPISIEKLVDYMNVFYPGWQAKQKWSTLRDIDTTKGKLTTIQNRNSKRTFNHKDGIKTWSEMVETVRKPKSFSELKSVAKQVITNQVPLSEPSRSLKKPLPIAGARRTTGPTPENNTSSPLDYTIRKRQLNPSPFYTQPIININVKAPKIKSSINPIFNPSFAPSFSPTSNSNPSFNPSFTPTSNSNPSFNPTFTPTSNPSFAPTSNPSFNPSSNPSFNPNFQPPPPPSVPQTVDSLAVIQAKNEAIASEIVNNLREELRLVNESKDRLITEKHGIQMELERIRGEITHKETQWEQEKKDMRSNFQAENILIAQRWDAKMKEIEEERRTAIALKVPSSPEISEDELNLKLAPKIQSIREDFEKRLQEIQTNHDTVQKGLHGELEEAKRKLAENQQLVTLSDEDKQRLTQRIATLESNMEQRELSYKSLLETNKKSYEDQYNLLKSTTNDNISQKFDEITKSLNDTKQKELDALRVNYEAKLQDRQKEYENDFYSSRKRISDMEKEFEVITNQNTILKTNVTELETKLESQTTTVLQQLKDTTEQNRLELIRVQNENANQINVFLDVVTLIQPFVIKVLQTRFEQEEENLVKFIQSNPNDFLSATIGWSDFKDIFQRRLESNQLPFWDDFIKDKTLATEKQTNYLKSFFDSIYDQNSTSFINRYETIYLRRVGELKMGTQHNIIQEKDRMAQKLQIETEQALNQSKNATEQLINQKEESDLQAMFLTQLSSKNLMSNVFDFTYKDLGIIPPELLNRMVVGKTADNLKIIRSSGLLSNVFHPAKILSSLEDYFKKLNQGVIETPKQEQLLEKTFKLQRNNLLLAWDNYFGTLLDVAIHKFHNQQSQLEFQQQREKMVNQVSQIQNLKDELFASESYLKTAEQGLVQVSEELRSVYDGIVPPITAPVTIIPSEPLTLPPIASIIPDIPIQSPLESLVPPPIEEEKPKQRLDLPAKFKKDKIESSEERTYNLAELATGIAQSNLQSKNEAKKKRDRETRLEENRGRRGTRDIEEEERPRKRSTSRSSELNIGVEEIPTFTLKPGKPQKGTKSIQDMNVIEAASLLQSLNQTKFRNDRDLSDLDKKRNAIVSEQLIRHIQDLNNEVPLETES